jgi:hypothetical protein
MKKESAAKGGDDMRKEYDLSPGDGWDEPGAD